MEIRQVPVERCRKDPSNPRTDLPAPQRQALVASVRKYGIKVPLIGYEVQETVMIGDGNCRLDAVLEIGLKEVPVIVFPRKPSDDELLITQLTIQGHRTALNPVDEYEAFKRLESLKGWSSSQLAQELAVSNVEVTRVMAIGKLSSEERQLVRDGRISKSSAYALSRMSPDERAEIVLKAATGEITRDQLNDRARRRKGDCDHKARRVNCRVPGGTVSVQAESGLDLDRLVELLDGLLRACRKLRTQGLNISTALRVLGDQCKVQSVP